MSEPAALLFALQYADSAFPAGGFAHSWGLESAVAEGDVRDAAGVERACAALLRHQAGPADAVAAAGCCEAAAGGDLERLTAIDRRLSATRAARESRGASARVGGRLLEVAAGAERDAWLEELRTVVQAGRTPGNHACMLGAVAGRLGMTPAAAATALLWTVANGCLSAAVRLLPVTHDQVQQTLGRLRPLIASLAAEAAVADPLRLAGTAPGWEIWSMQHETSLTRLFAS